MFHATFITILECFIHTLQHYYTFSGTNLLTRCRSASCCSLQTNTIFHSIRLILCFQQAGEIDNLTVTLGQSILIVLCSFHVGAGFTGVAPHYIPPPTTFTCFLAPTGSITFVSYRGKTCCCAHHTFLLGFPTDVYIYVHQHA